MQDPAGHHVPVFVDGFLRAIHQHDRALRRFHAQGGGLDQHALQFEFRFGGGTFERTREHALGYVAGNGK